MFWRRRKDVGARVITYHRVLPDDTNPWLVAALSGEVVTSSVFGRQLDWLSKRYQLVPLDCVLAEPDRSELMAITFDDGMVDFKLHAYPALAQRQLPATLFMVAGLVGHDAVFDHHAQARAVVAQRHAALSAKDPKRALRQLLEAERLETVAHPDDRFLDAAEIAELASLGVSIQSHGLTHTSFGKLSEEAAASELVTSKQDLEAMTQTAISYFAYPIGKSADIAHQAAVAAAGFKAAFGGSAGSLEEADPYCLPRTGIRQEWRRFKKHFA